MGRAQMPVWFPGQPQSLNNQRKELFCLDDIDRRSLPGCRHPQGSWWVVKAESSPARRGREPGLHGAGASLSSGWCREESGGGPRAPSSLPSAGRHLSCRHLPQSVVTTAVCPACGRNVTRSVTSLTRPAPPALQGTPCGVWRCPAGPPSREACLCVCGRIN